MANISKPVAAGTEGFLFQTREGRTIADYQSGDIVYTQGDPADSIYYLQEGIAKKTVTSIKGRDVVLSMIPPGDFFGEGCLSTRTHRRITVTAITACSAIRIDKPTMMRGLRNDPQFSEFFIKFLLARNSRTVDDLVNQMLNPSEMRLAHTLLLLANFDKPNSQIVTIQKVSQETLAEMVGTTRSRVSFFMNKFRRRGLIDYGNSGHDLRVNASLLDMVLKESGCADTVSETHHTQPRRRAARG